MVHIGAWAYMYSTVTACCLWHNVGGGGGGGKGIWLTVLCDVSCFIQEGKSYMVRIYFIGRQSVCDSVAMEDSYVCSSHYNVMRWRKDRIVDIIRILLYKDVLLNTLVQVKEVWLKHPYQS